MKINNMFRSFMPHIAPVPFAEKVRSALAGGVSILLLAAVPRYIPHGTYPLMMLASMSASALIIFVMPHSPLAHPWNLVGGHLISAIAAWICIVFIPDPLLATGVGVGVAIFLMHYLNCLHPPSAATAVIIGSAQFQNMGFKSVMIVVLINAVICLVLALVINNLLLRRQYPIQHTALPHPNPSPFPAIERQDLEMALVQMGSVIDVSEEDLAQIYELAQRNAQQRNIKPTGHSSI